MANDLDETAYPVKLFFSKGNILVWDKEDALKLRRDYRIVGSLIGSLPRKPKQNIFLSLPLLLLPEEASLLVEHKIGILVNGSDTIRSPSKEEVLTFQINRDKSLNAQIEYFKTQRYAKQEELAEIIEQGRKRKRGHCSVGLLSPEKKARFEEDKEISGRYELGNLHVSTSDELQVGDAQDLDEPGPAQKLTNYDKKTRMATCNDQIRTSCISNVSSVVLPSKIISEDINDLLQTPLPDEKNNASECQEVSASSTYCNTTLGREREDDTSKLSGTLIHVPTASSKSCGSCDETLWTYPSTQSEQIKYAVYRDLWEKGYYITSGGKFGGDYLVYPGDPMRFHSFFVVVVVQWKEKISACDLISMGRLGSSVKKTSVYASVDDQEKVRYTSVRWTGMS